MPQPNSITADTHASPLPFPKFPARAAGILAAAEKLADLLAQGKELGTDRLSLVMEQVFGGSDAEGQWSWRDAYEASEAAEVMFLKRHLPAMARKVHDPLKLLGMLRKVSGLLATQTRRTEDTQAYQQFSTPAELAYLLNLAAGVTSQDVVLEPSAGTGMLAVFGAAQGAHLHLNELAGNRADILDALFPDSRATRLNAAHIDDTLPIEVRPTVVVMNPPFSVAPGVSGTYADADLIHLRSALRRLQPGGRLVAITSFSLHPHNADYRAAFEKISESATLRFTTGIWGQAFKQRGTGVATRMYVFDKLPGTIDERAMLPGEALSPQTLLQAIQAKVPPRLHVDRPTEARTVGKPIIVHLPARPTINLPGLAQAEPREEVTYSLLQANDTKQLSDALYEPYTPETILIHGAKPHPTKLVQSTAMASVKPPLPSYKPHLSPGLVQDGVLSDAQLESIIYAGEAHSSHLAGYWKVNDTFDVLQAVQEGMDGAVRFRRGWFLGDGTGAGKGRQVAGIILDNKLKGRRRAIWISKSDKLLEDAQRDWDALGQERLQVVPLDRYRPGAPVKLKEGILFTTYATLRATARDGKSSRLAQLLQWAGADFDGPIIFDEAHAMANAAGGTSERGDRAPSQQGLSGLKLQHALPEARVVYVSATGATTVENLAYAQRLGLWGSDDLPFDNRADFVAAMQMGGIASAEVLARDLKTCGLYAARSLSYEGVEVDILEHELTPEQVRIYDAYAKAYQVIHGNLVSALRASGVSGEDGQTLNKVAKSAAHSAFEASKQRFFNHLITAMKMPSVIGDISEKLDAGKACVVQLVSTSEALMERRLSQMPASEWSDLSFDVTPREYVLDYLQHSFPTALYEPYTDEEGNLQSRPVIVDGRVVESREAIEARERMIQHLAALPPVQAALDQLIHHFGTDGVAEVTGRSRRIVKTADRGGVKLSVQNRPMAANLAETQSFMDDKKRILVFSEAGGTGRSYHADLNSLNQRHRVHYLVEAGWKADAAVQGLGRTNRTNQAQPPLFRPVTTNIRGEKRFLSTIARRLDSLGAITRGQRQTGGQGLFRASDNLESSYARAALRQFYGHLHQGRVACCSLQKFEEVTGLKLLDSDMTLKEDLPPISTFLNRLLAIEIDLQNQLFAHFEDIIAGIMDKAISDGTFDVGLETIRAEGLRIISRKVLETHGASGAVTEVLEIERKDRNRPMLLPSALNLAKEAGAIMLVNAKSGRAAVATKAPSLTLEDGTTEKRVRISRPMERTNIPAASLDESYWRPADEGDFVAAWAKEVEELPEFAFARFQIMTGLLLPIWKRLPYENPRVYRFQTDDGQRVLGRLIPAEHIQQFAAGEKLTADSAWQRLLGRATVSLNERMMLKPVLAMYARRFELVGFHDSQLERLKAMGCIPEIVQWKLRLFVPVSEEGKATVAQILERYAA